MFSYNSPLLTASVTITWPAANFLRGLHRNYDNIWGPYDMLGPEPIASGSLEWPQGRTRSINSLSDLETS